MAIRTSRLMSIPATPANGQTTLFQNHATPEENEDDMRTETEYQIAVCQALGWERWKNFDGTVRLIKPRDDAQRAYWRECGAEITTEPVNTPIVHLPPLTLDL